eukprot:293756_1
MSSTSMTTFLTVTILMPVILSYGTRTAGDYKCLASGGYYYAVQCCRTSSYCNSGGSYYDDYLQMQTYYNSGTTTRPIETTSKFDCADDSFTQEDGGQRSFLREHCDNWKDLCDYLGCWVTDKEEI